MEQRKPKWHEPASAVEVEQLLASRYSQLLKWASVLSRSDDGKAQDIVQELCLYFTLTKPDLRNVANLDGYLYTCLRHIYLSGLARSSREAQHFVSVGEFDSFESAIASHQSGDPLQRQNDLRRICSYAVWRKETSKTASYFIFHFFHGYSRREIAELARLPIAAIYNKLKIARAEVKSHLEDSGKLRILNRELPPEPVFSWGLLSSSELFREFRKTILNARRSDCLPEEELLAQYRSSTATPISCSLLAHLVSCERCIAVVDRNFRRPTLDDREPLDGFGSSSGGGNKIMRGPKDLGHDALLRSIRRGWSCVHEHRPQTLSIAVNGKIIAFHDVQAEQSILSARIEHPDRVEFVEVFSEQDVRLALLPIGDLPPDGPQIRSQHVTLSDARWLELNLTFDGLGLNSQVAYFDPTLGSEVFEETEDSAIQVEEPNDEVPHSHIQPEDKDSWLVGIGRLLRPMVPSSAMAWAFVLMILLGVSGYLAYRRITDTVDAREILKQSVSIEATALRGQTEHQVLQLEEVSADGRVLQQSTVDLWKDGDGSRYMRRLYDSRHRLIAAEWRNKNGEHRSQHKQRGQSLSDIHQPALISRLWDESLSAQAFSMLDGKATRVRIVEGGYELTTLAPIAHRPQLVSATLVLDRHLYPVREIMHVRTGSGIRELRFVQVSYESKPSLSIPDTLFDPKEELRPTPTAHSFTQQDKLSKTMGADLQLAQLQIAVLYQLNNLDSDTGEPIEVVRMPDGYIRVSGTIADSSLRRNIVSHLEALKDHHLLDLRLFTPSEINLQRPNARLHSLGDTSVYDLAQTKPKVDTVLRRYFQSKQLSGAHLDSAVEQYSRDALQHAQHALQHAYALNRLSSALSADEFRSIGLPSKQRWTEMVSGHATDLEMELYALHNQLAEIESPEGHAPNENAQFITLENPEQFDRATAQLLRQTQKLNTNMGALFTSDPSGTEDAETILAATIKAIPLHQAEEITHFAARLKAARGSELSEPPVDRHGEGIPEQP